MALGEARGWLWWANPSGPASEALLNRAWGRPSLAISAEGEAEPVELIVRWAGQ